VLRAKNTEYRDTHLDIHTFFGWVDVTAQVGAGAGLGQDTIITYNFISNTEKEFIAAVQMDPSGMTIEQVDYKDNGVISSQDDLAAERPEVLVSPNPTVDEAVIELKNFAPGSYTLRLLDARGNMVSVQKLMPGSMVISLAEQASGTYFYQVFDEKNQVKSSGKLLKINR
jgi:hypothetical protein